MADNKGLFDSFYFSDGIPMDDLSSNQNSQEFHDFIANEENNCFPISKPQEVNSALDHLDKVPDFEVTNNDAQFNVLLPEYTGSNWVYSEILDQLYIKRNKPIPITFNFLPSAESLYVRIMPFFVDESYRREAVYRCRNHENKDDTNEAVAANILYCEGNDVQYRGLKEGITFSERLAVITKMGCNLSTETITLKFLCQNSCATGMFRRATALIFTLENDKGAIVGKQVLKLRVASGPSRDMNNDEKDYQGPRNGKKRIQKQFGPSKKRICRSVEVKREVCSETDEINNSDEGDVVEDPIIKVTLNLPNVAIALHVCRCAYNAFAAAIVDNPRNADQYRRSMQRIQKMQKNLTNSELD